MKRFISLIITSILIITAMFAMSSVAFATSVEMTVTSDKASLSGAGQIEFTAAITNNSGAELSGYTIDYSCGENNFTESSGEAIADGASANVVFTCDVTDDMLDQEITFVLLDSTGGELAKANATIKKAPDILKVGVDNIDVVLLQMRLRDLGYFNYRATGRFLTMTEKAVKSFQEHNGLDTDGHVGPSTFAKIFETNVVRKPLSPEIRVTSGPALTGTPTYGELADWFEVIDPAFPIGDTVTVTDFNSGATFQMTRTGGTNHAEVEPPNSDEYNKYIDSFGGIPNWEKRSVLVKIGDKTYAASLFGNQMGEDTISNNTMSGHTCLYFQGSLSHVLGFTDKEHEKMILKAAGKPIQYPES